MSLMPVVYLNESEIGYDNRIELSLRVPQDEDSDPVPVSLAAVTNITFSIPSIPLTIESTSPSEGPIIWDEEITEEVGKVMLSFGGELVVEGSFTGWMITYDPDHPNGIVWGGPTGIAFSVVLVPSNGDLS